MPAFSVHVTIENKPGISDPEGETILNDLVLKGAHVAVTGIRTAKMLKFAITEDDAESAKAAVRRICDELRIYNPLVSRIEVACHESGTRAAS